MPLGFELLIFMVFLSSACMCGLLVAASRDVPRLAGRPSDLEATQRTHRRITPRVGGLGIFAGLLVGLYLLSVTLDRFNFTAMAPILLGPLILVAVALSEDLGFRVNAAGRLIATLFASLLVGTTTGIWLETLGVSALDTMMQSAWLSIPVTLFLTAALAHGFNLIDGVNGLSSGGGLFGALACGFVSLNCGAPEIGYLSLMLAAAILGFMCFNFPFGWIFLGDTGAYLIGFVLAWLGIALVETTESVSAWTLILLFFWPLADVLFAVVRRVVRRRSPFAPDRLHLHSIINRLLTLLGRRYPIIAQWRNPLTTILLLPLVATSPVIGFFLCSKQFEAFIAVVGSTAVYGLLLLGVRPLYRATCRFTRCASQTTAASPHTQARHHPQIHD